MFCRDKHVFVATKVYLSRQNVCRDKQNCVATNICRDKRFVATKIFCCDKQYFRDKTFVTTSILLLRQKTCLSREKKKKKTRKTGHALSFVHFQTFPHGLQNPGIPDNRLILSGFPAFSWNIVFNTATGYLTFHGDLTGDSAVTLDR